ncbi:MAG: metallophosphoesterase [Candidatus Acidiferrum sp.]
MSDIRYICISDLHLGADNSLLTHLGSKIGEVDPHYASPLLKELAKCLWELVRHNSGPVKPTLILNGDLLELALAEDNVALMAFERFIELMFPSDGEPLIDRTIIFNPGNHDHHLWETARETQYVEFLEGKRSAKAHGVLPSPWHTTKMFSVDLVNCRLLNAVIGRKSHLSDRGVHVGTVYPNLAFDSSDGERRVIFSHGHFIESVYMLMSAIGDFVFPSRKMPERIWEVEAENFAWIDFFWSALGRSGAVGKDIEQVYDMLLVPEARKDFIRQLARAGGRHWFHQWPKLGEFLSLFFVPFISMQLRHLGALEKRQPGEVLTLRAIRGLKAYMEGPLAKQIQEECRDSTRAQTTFIFGHTHKPFSASFQFEHFPRPVHVYNSGGWVVDTIQTESAHGGALILADDDLNVASVRLYNETENHLGSRVKVDTVDGRENLLSTRLVEIVHCEQEPWLSFSRVVAENVDVYHQRFQDRLNLVKAS